MPNIINYIEDFKDYSFKEYGFNEIDALLFSQLSYIDFSAIVGKFDNDDVITLKEASKLYFTLHDKETDKKEISIIQKALLLMEQCADSKRYSDIKLLRYVNNVNDKIDKQFSAINFFIDDQTAVIAFRGTDTSLTGIKESAMLSYMFPVPAQIEALHYLQECGLLAQRNVIVCGHSKGGNLATFAGVSCSNSLKKKIKAIYEFDAPGFPIQMIERYDYVQMEEKIHSYIPESSIIGCMLEHNKSRKVVKSIEENLRQHQVSSWQIENGKFILCEQTDEISKFVDKYIKQLTLTVGEENIEEMFETVFDFLENSGVTNYNDFKSFDFSRMIKAIDTLKNVTDEQKELLENIVKQSIIEFSHLVYTEKISPLAKLFDRSKSITESSDNNN